MSLFRTKDADHMIRVGHSDIGLKKVLGPPDLTLFGVDAIIGTDIFALTGTGALIAGPAFTLSFTVAALACGFVVLCCAESALTIPVSGSTYTYVYATMGKLAVWIIGWDLVLKYGLATSAVSVGQFGYSQSLLPGSGLHPPVALTAALSATPGMQVPFNLPVLVIMLLITTLLSLGIHESACANNIMVAIKVTVVLLLIVVGVRHVQPVNRQPSIPFGMEGVFGAAAIAFFVFIGFDVVTLAAEEVCNPKRDLPTGIIDSLAVCTVLHVVVAAIMTGIVPLVKFADVDRPVSLVLQVAGENWVADFVDLGVIIGIMTAILVMAYGQTRIIFAMSRDGLLPKRLSHIHPRYSTLLLNTWVVGIVFVLIAAFVPLNVLAELINIGMLTAFSSTAVAVLVLRRTRPDLHHGFRCPGVPVVPLLAIGPCLLLMSQLQAITWIALVVWISIGLVVYFGYAHRRSLLHGSESGPAPVFEMVH